ncbi:coiled-coil domain-containing protein [Flavobacterium agrisoli]|uniref:Competence protein CoiA-like protein n=1 Tax=Flavobacterium agrisoli TaxID=2793066 RepID=A0A934PQQ3_9FLAO|nr:hypothetical protein [Flavobacterium agrisoli]MBK0371164.1 hypothetical protein [Flavobacterium agrisoli]
MEKSNPNPNSKEQNEYAKNVKGEPIYILEAESGRKGYWCMGCDAEMEAVIQKKNTYYKSYFRHIAKDVKKGEIPCTFSNQDYRHNLAIDILQRTKRIKVPNLYKYAPDGKSAKLIQETIFVEAHSVKKELSFYEDDDGEVKFGKNPDIDNKNLLIRPDVTFFDIHGKPILLIEIVVSHKLNDEKKAKIKRLGIDTIQIIIPKDSPENIAKNFLVTKNTRWVFNHVEQNTNYFQLSAGDAEGISQIDELQMGLLRESITCRKNQISNLIRSITRCLESQSYKRTEFQLGQEISRIETNTERTKLQLEQLRSQFRKAVENRHSQSLESIEQAERDFQQFVAETENNLYDEYYLQYSEIEERYSNLESRYIAKRETIESETAIISQQLERRFSLGKSEADIRGQFEPEKRRIENEIAGINREQGYIEDDTEQESEFERNFAGQKSRIEEAGRILEQEFGELENQERERFETYKRQFQSDTTDERKLRSAMEDEFRSGYQWLYEQIAERINKRD